MTRTPRAALGRARHRRPASPAGRLSAVLRASVLRPWALALVAALALAPVVAVLAAAPAEAATIRAFTPVFSANTNGDILIAANTLETCQSSAGCTTARNATTGNYSNNDYNSSYVDVDANAGTFNSSRATLTIPSGGTVLYALLVWGGRTTGSAVANANPALRNQALFTVPDGAGTRDIAVTASQVDVASDNAYQSTLDVTDVVAAAGSGTYTMANVQSSVGSTNQYAGWSLVVAVGDPNAPARNLTVFTGFASVANGDPLPTFTVSGFLTPPSGTVRTTLGAVTYEGDMGLTGDTFYLNSTQITDALNPGTNPFNSTISNRGVQATGRTPSYNNQLGYDADLFVADGVLANGATSADLTLTTGGEQYFPGVVTFATDLYDPKLTGGKTVVDLNGGSVERGDVLEYTVPVENIGLDTASNSTFFDAVPTGTSYVAGSLTVDGAPLTDAVGDDQGEYLNDGGNGHVLARMGTGADATVGGDIPVTSGSAQHTVVFRVTVDGGVANAQPLVNAAALTYQGLTTRAASSSVTNAVVSAVSGAPAVGSLPVATPDLITFSPTAGTPSATIPVLDNDTDADGGPLTVIGLTDAAGGTVAINPDGTVSYTPRADFAGRDVFTYTISDPDGNVSTTTVYVEVLNTAPTAVDDTATTPGGTPVDVPVLDNDADDNGDVLTVRSVDATSAHGGTIAPVGGVVTYTPAAGYLGADTFDYVVQDSRGGSATATVTVTVTNGPPSATDDTVATTTGVATVVPVLANDTDPESHALNVTAVTQPAAGGSVSLVGGVVTFTPAPGFAGTTTFTYTVSDGHGGTDTATVTVTVNGAPVATDDSGSTPGDTPLVGLAVLDNDSDPNSDALVVTGTSSPSHGGVVVNADGTVTYTPDTGWAGTDTFTYTVSDGTLTDTATVTVTVANQAPVAGPDTASTPTDTALTGVDVLANDSDPNVTAGVPGQALAVTAASGDHGATVSVNPDGTLDVTPATGYAGTITVTYTLSDGAGGSTTGTLTVTVANGVPSAAADTASTPTDTPVTIDVLDNDSDPNSDPLTIVPGSPTTPVDVHGDPQGTVAIVAGQVEYTPATGFAGTVTFDYEVSDGNGGTATATVTVTVLNAPPVGVGDAASTATDTPVTVDVLGNDTDANIPGTAQVLTVTAASADHGATVVVEADGRLTVTPAVGYSGTVTVSYTVSDGAGGTDTVTLTVDVANAAPVAVPDSASTPYLTAVDVDLLANDTDANGDTLSVVPGSLTVPVDGDGNPRGTVTLVGGVATYTPPAGFSGTVTFDYTVTDGAASRTATVTVTVGNAPPVTVDDSVKTPRGASVTIPVVGNDSDPDGGTVTVTSVTQPARGGTVAIVDGALVFTPTPGFSGTVSFTYTVEDGQGGVSTATVLVEVEASVITADGHLASTGLDPRAPFVAAGLLVLLGAGLVVARRRLTVA